MPDSFNRVNGKPDDPFYYGLKPSAELELFLQETHPPGGEALDLGCGEGRNSLLLARYGFMCTLLIHQARVFKNSKYTHSHKA